VEGEFSDIVQLDGSVEKVEMEKSVMDDPVEMDEASPSLREECL
jgi:hypothetical protein